MAAIGGTYYSMSGGDGGPGQMGYVTPHSAEMMGKAVMDYWRRGDAAKNDLGTRFAIESAANVMYDPLQKRLLDYSGNGPEALRSQSIT